MDLTLVNTRSILVCIDDVRIVTKGTKNELLNKMKEVMKVLDEQQLRAEKCVMPPISIEWLNGIIQNIVL